MSEYASAGSDVPTKITPKVGDVVHYTGTRDLYRVQRLNEDGSVALVPQVETARLGYFGGRYAPHRSTPSLLTLVERAA